MKKYTTSLLLLLSFLTTTLISAQTPQVVSGRLHRITNFASQYVNTRHIDIWLPEGYNTRQQYSVLYMHDGQMLFDSSTTWNHQCWEVDEVAAKLLKTGQVPNFIVVGIWNVGALRHQNYFPQKPFDAMTKKQKKQVRRQLQQAGRTKTIFQPDSDNYLKFIVSELKPAIDTQFAVYRDREHTFIAGSSMGGLISMYAICEYPEVFGGAVCMSTHWPGIFSVENNPVPEAFMAYLRHHLPDPKTHKLYFDYGDQTLDAMYPPLQKQADGIIWARGFTPQNWVTRYFPGDAHTEQAWSRRLAQPLLFLMKE